MNSVLRRLPGLYDRIRLRSQNFVIVSNNCWGFECYKTLRRKYNTPFVGLFIYPEHYLKLLNNFSTISQQELTFTDRSVYLEDNPNYPIGLIYEDVEIHFMHYASEGDAKTKWFRRLRRMEDNISKGVQIVFKMCDRDGGGGEHLKAFHALPLIVQHKSISFSVDELNLLNHMKATGDLTENEKKVIDGLLLYRKRYKTFDFAEWLISGKVQKTFASRMLGQVQ